MTVLGTIIAVLAAAAAGLAAWVAGDRRGQRKGADVVKREIERDQRSRAYEIHVEVDDIMHKVEQGDRARLREIKRKAQHALAAPVDTELESLRTEAAMIRKKHGL